MFVRPGFVLFCIFQTSLRQSHCRGPALPCPGELLHRERCYTYLQPWVCVGDVPVSSGMMQGLSVLSLGRVPPHPHRQVLLQVPGGRAGPFQPVSPPRGSPEPQPQTEHLWVPLSQTPCSTFLPERAATPRHMLKIHARLVMDLGRSVMCI